jgi:hypothetical protein
MGDWCGSKKDRHFHQMKNRVQKTKEAKPRGQEVTLQEII